MRRPAPVSLPVALTIAGSDSGGGAGIQADLRTMSAHETFPTSVVTSVTAQHTRGVERSTVLDAADVRAQYEAVADDFDVRAAKTGMLGTPEVVRTVSDCVSTSGFPLVVDPVMVATSGDRLLDAAGERAYEGLVSEATLVTPNRDEAAVLTGIDPAEDATARKAGDRLIEMGADAALVTGGHGDDDSVRDVLVTPEGVSAFVHPRIDAAATHGSGCSLSAAIAANLGAGADLERAVEDAIAFAARAVRYPLDVGRGPGAVHHLVDLRNEAARERTVRDVRGLVERFVADDVSALVPEVGMNVVGATPYAESVSETAAVEGRITRTMDGVEPNRGVRFGASSHLARFLLAAREHAPALRFATNCGLSESSRAALETLEAPVAWFDRADEPAASSTMDWAAERAFEAADEPPTAIADEGAVGKEPMIRVVGETPEEVAAVVDHLRPPVNDSR
ncbi:bifunctional hydroxymethylpyrimidine kinase/phosphomethylpyrimidine kinase [Halorubrum sp. AD140]|uniref:bifunctional hydroxymethylpyrimidine kinase/phosphomethylpyrimidine kinase n=1 Tax=Halorubrum sp. AD140 TaxID=3050073 RepID=UPI002ACC39C2|nr:bifunctional hydroxymethylpyrimidine kinase/phosphomethylpyrimidine kinase [Halorubrum sp. AD140]MDZ5810605.1 bifunctional hydroxymethylpyrimidine kinase/phosphomethylpyrimidine kinase [Halorubrum sp. AD140]